MSINKGGWEGLLLAFAMIFTVLIGLSYMIATFFRIPVPWLAILVGAAALTLALGYIRGRRA